MVAVSKHGVENHSAANDLNNTTTVHTLPLCNKRRSRIEMQGCSRAVFDDEVRLLVTSTTTTSGAAGASVPFFRHSLFSNVPPTIQFTCTEEKVEKPKKCIRKMLKWKYNSLIPRVVKKTLITSHFEIVSAEAPYWMGYWGRHWKTADFKQILPYQKVNHFPGAFHIGRKDKLWANIHRFIEKYPKSNFDIMPKTFILPRDGKLLKEKMKADGQMTPVILKPPASARGTGVRVVHRWNQIPRKDALIVQTYIENPFLIYGSKFDLRLYVYVTSLDPLIVYLYEEGLVRFASIKYSKSLSTIANRLMHLTNYSLNKHSVHDENIENRSETGVKWSLSKFWTFIEQSGLDAKKLKKDIVDLVIKSFICCETPVNSYIEQTIVNGSVWSCHELFGFDVVVDDQLKPWLVEVNISPSLQSSTDLDKRVKGRLAMDVLNLAGLQVPEKRMVQSCSSRVSADYTEPGHWYNADYRIKPWCKFGTSGQQFSDKQQTFVHSFRTTRTGDPTILNNLLSEDLRILTDFEDEFERRGNFRRIFPRQETTTVYLKYFDTVRYANLLLDEWLNQYFHIRQTGLRLLESFCLRKVHISEPKEEEKLDDYSLN